LVEKVTLSLNPGSKQSTARQNCAKIGLQVAFCGKHNFNFFFVRTKPSSLSTEAPHAIAKVDVPPSKQHGESDSAIKSLNLMIRFCEIRVGAFARSVKIESLSTSASLR